MDDLIKELKKMGADFKVLSDGSIDCEGSNRVNFIECGVKYKWFTYVDDFETGSCRYHIIKR